MKVYVNKRLVLRGSSMIEIKRVGDIVKKLNITPDRENKPKKIIYELSECKTYYNCQMYFDAVVDGKTEEMIISVKAKDPSYAYDFYIMPDDEEEAMFILTIPDMED